MGCKFSDSLGESGGAGILLETVVGRSVGFVLYGGLKQRFLLDLLGGAHGQLLDGAQDRHCFRIFLVERRCTDSAVGLEGAELVHGAVIIAQSVAVVAVDAVQGFGFGVVEQGVEPVGHEAGFEGAEALDVPACVKQDVEGFDFKSALRVDFGEQEIAKLVEFFDFIFADDDLPGGQAVRDGILRRDGLAVVGARAG